MHALLAGGGGGPLNKRKLIINWNFGTHSVRSENQISLGVVEVELSSLFSESVLTQVGCEGARVEVK